MIRVPATGSASKAATARMTSRGSRRMGHLPSWLLVVTMVAACAASFAGGWFASRASSPARVCYVAPSEPNPFLPDSGPQLVCR